MSDKFQLCLALVLKHEGGWSDNPKDPGGATMQGITLATYSHFMGRPMSKDELRYMPAENRDAIYHEMFWEHIHGDDLPTSLAMVTFDAAVNSGNHRAVYWLQQALGVDADGIPGPDTAKAAAACDVAAVVKSVCALRLSFLKSLPTWVSFGRGWQERVDDTESQALAVVVQ